MLTNITKRIGRGFTLIELMIVVAIIGILAAIAIPNFVKFQCRSKQSEAKTNLKALYVAEEAYRGEYDLYVPITDNTTSNFAGWNPKGAKIRYNYSAVGANSTFTGTGLGVTDSVNTDSWRITQQNDLTNLINACT